MSPGVVLPRVVLRILERVEYADSGCWEWAGGHNGLGYGRIHVDGAVQYTHRVMYERYVGPIAENLVLDHLCRNPKCCNPGHLEPVTQQENTRRGARSLTHCKNGHAFDDANTYWHRGRRWCRACGATRGRAYRAAKAVAL